MNRTKDRARRPILPRNRVDIWPLTLDVADREYLHLRSLLSSGETARGERLVTEQLRRRWMTCRGRVRQILARYLNMEPAAVRLACQQLGKPYVRVGADPVPLHFNVSHSGSRAVVACAAQPVGVDIEVQEVDGNISELEDQILSPRERSERRSGPGKPAANEQELLRAWVCKEALLKAIGVGIGRGMHQVELPASIPVDAWFRPDRVDPAILLRMDDSGTCSRTAWCDASFWRIRLFYTMSRHRTAAAVAVPADVDEIRFQSAFDDEQLTMNS